MTLNSDSENEDNDERQGNEVDPVLTTSGMFEEQGSDDEEGAGTQAHQQTERPGEGEDGDGDGDGDDDDDDDDDVPHPNKNTHSELVQPPAGGKPAPVPADTDEAAPARKEPLKRNAAAAWTPRQSSPPGDDFDEDDESGIQHTQEVRVQPAFPSIDMAADAELVRKQMDTTPAETEAVYVKAHVSPAAREKTYLFRNQTKHGYAMLDGHSPNLLHQRIDDEYAPFAVGFKTQYAAGKKATAKTSWIDGFLNRNMSRVLAQVNFIKIKHAKDGPQDVSMLCSVEVELVKDEGVDQKAFDDFMKKVPQVKCSKLVHFSEQHVKRMYSVTDSGLPTDFDPVLHPNVHYREIKDVQEQASIDESWKVYVAPTKPRTGGGRKPSAGPAAGDNPDAKKQKVGGTHQTHMTGHLVAAGATSAQASASAATGDRARTDTEGEDEGEEDVAEESERQNGHANGLTTQARASVGPALDLIWHAHEDGSRVCRIKSKKVHYACVENPEGWTIIETKLDGSK